MCISLEIEDKWIVFIEFMIFFLLQGLDVGTHAGIFVMVNEKVQSCAKLVNHMTQITCYKDENGTVSYINSTLINQTKTLCNSDFLYCANGGNGTAAALKSSQEHLDLVHQIFLAFLCLGGLFFIAHVGLLIPNLAKAFKEKDMEAFRENAPSYYRNVLKFHVVLLVVETIFFDIPSGSIVMEIIAHLWKSPNNFNCWECATTLAAVPKEVSLDQSKLFIALTCIGIAFIAMYKGACNFIHCLI